MIEDYKKRVESLSKEQRSLQLKLAESYNELVSLRPLKEENERMRSIIRDLAAAAAPPKRPVATVLAERAFQNSPVATALPSRPRVVATQELRGRLALRSVKPKRN